MRITPVLLLLGGAILGIACTPSGRDDTANGGLANTSWTVATISGAPSLPDARPTMTFDPSGALSGNGGCNQYSTTYRTDGSSIAIGQIASTLMACEGDRGAQETAFLNALQGATAWRLLNDGNLLLSGIGDIVAGPGSAAAPSAAAGTSDLAGSDWTLIDMGGTADFAHLVPTLHFGEDGMVSGYAGCNKFSGSYTVDGSDLTLGPLASTKMACEPPASAVESAMLEALAGVSSWSIGEDGRLTLGGAVPLKFTRN
jgi:heat shock protein HslJ